MESAEFYLSDLERGPTYTDIRPLFFLCSPLFHIPQYHPEGGAHGYGYFSVTLASGQVRQYEPMSRENLEVVQDAADRHKKAHNVNNKQIKESNRGLPIVIQETAGDHY